MSKQRERLTPEERKSRILSAAVSLSIKGNYAEVTRHHIAEFADVSPTLVSHYFGTPEDLRDAIMREAIKWNNPFILAQGLVRKDPLALEAPEDLRKSAIKTINN